MRRVLAVAAALALTSVGLTTVSSPSNATTPGTNGDIVFGADQGLGIQLFVISPNGRGFHQLMKVYGDATAADWSTNGRRIVFEHDFERDGVDHGQIMMINANGNNLHHVTRAGIKHQPAFTRMDTTWSTSATATLRACSSCAPTVPTAAACRPTPSLKKGIVIPTSPLMGRQ